MALKESKTNTSKIMLILGGAGVSIFLLFVLAAVYLSGSDKRAIQSVVNQVNINHYVNKGKIKQLVNSMSRVDLSDCPADFKEAYLYVIHTGQDLAKNKGDALGLMSLIGGGAYAIGKELGGEEGGVVAGLMGAFMSAPFAGVEYDEELAFEKNFMGAVRHLENLTLSYNVKM